MQPVQSVTAAVAVAVAVAVDPNPLHFCSPPSPPPQKLPPSITTGWAHYRRRRRHDPRNIRTLSSQTYSTTTPTHTHTDARTAATTVIVIHRGRLELACGSPSLLHRHACPPAAYDLDQAGCIACPSQQHRPAHHQREGPHHASDKAAFLPRVLTEPEQSATTTWAFLELAS